MLLLIAVITNTQYDEPVTNVEDFCPEEGLDASFLDDTKEVHTSAYGAQRKDESSDRSVHLLGKISCVVLYCL